MADDQSTKWLPVPGWEGFYEVSNTGRVRSINRRMVCRDGIAQRYQARELTLCDSQNGYPRVHLRDTVNGRRRWAMVHRLVALAFVPNPENKPNVNHIDCNTYNAAATNLEWCTQRENLAHAARLGRMSHHALGKRPAHAKLSNRQVYEIRELYAAGNTSWADLGRRFLVGKRTIGRIIRRQSYV